MSYPLRFAFSSSNSMVKLHGTDFVVFPILISPFIDDLAESPTCAGLDVKGQGEQDFKQLLAAHHVHPIASFQIHMYGMSDISI